MSTIRPLGGAVAVMLLVSVAAHAIAAPNDQKGQAANGFTTDKAGRLVPPAPPGTILKPGENPIDLGTALALAGVQNPDLLLARERLTAAAAARMLAAAQALPNINAGTNYDLHRGPLQQSNGNILKVHRDALFLGLGANAVAAGTINIPGVQYNLNVGTAWFNYLQSQQTVAMAAAATRTANNNIMLRVCIGYCELLRGNARRAVAYQNRLEAAEIARITEVYARAGQGRQADANRAAVELRKRDAELTQAEADAMIASARLCRTLNLDPSTRLRPLEEYLVPVPVVPDPLPLQELLAIALIERPELAERRSETLRTMYALTGAKLLPFSPTVMLGFSSGYFGGGSDLVSQGFIGGDGKLQQAPRFGDLFGRYDVDAVFYWTAQNLGVGNLAKIRVARSINRQAELRQLETLNMVRSQVAEFQARAAAQFVQIDTTGKAIRASSEAYEADMKRIKQREGLPIELIDSLRLLNRSRYEHLDAIVDYNEAHFQLYVAIGRPPADVLARPAVKEPGQPGVAMPAPRLLPPGVRGDK